MSDDLNERLAQCRRRGHDYGLGPGMLPRVDLSTDTEATCRVCGTRREVKDGRVTWHSPPELTKHPEGEVK